MGKIKTVVNWFGEAAKKIKDSFGTGLEALNPNKIADTIKKK